MATESTTPTESEAAAPPHPEAAEGVQKPKEQRSWRYQDPFGDGYRNGS